MVSNGPNVVTKKNNRSWSCYPLVIEHSHGISMAIEIDGLPNLKMVDLSVANCFS